MDVKTLFDRSHTERPLLDWTGIHGDMTEGLQWTGYPFEANERAMFLPSLIVAPCFQNQYSASLLAVKYFVY